MLRLKHGTEAARQVEEPVSEDDVLAEEHVASPVGRVAVFGALTDNLDKPVKNETKEDMKREKQQVQHRLSKHLVYPTHFTSVLA